MGPYRSMLNAVGMTLNLVFPFSILMGWALRRNFTKTLKGVADELESYARARQAA